jgi:hypothetical protein
MSNGEARALVEPLLGVLPASKQERQRRARRSGGVERRREGIAAKRKRRSQRSTTGFAVGNGWAAGRGRVALLNSMTNCHFPLLLEVEIRSCW